MITLAITTGFIGLVLGILLASAVGAIFLATMEDD